MFWAFWLKHRLLRIGCLWCISLKLHARFHILERLLNLGLLYPFHFKIEHLILQFLECQSLIKMLMSAIWSLSKLEKNGFKVMKPLRKKNAPKSQFISCLSSSKPLVKTFRDSASSSTWTHIYLAFLLGLSTTVSKSCASSSSTRSQKKPKSSQKNTRT